MSSNTTASPLSLPGTEAVAGSSTGPDTNEAWRKRRKVTRSKAGCLCCRKRRKKCDMVKPECLACGRLQITCEWPPLRSMMNTPPRSDVEPSLTPSRDATEGPTARQGDSTPISIPNMTEDSAADGLMDLFSSEQPDYQTLSSTLGTTDRGGASGCSTAQNDLDVFGFDESTLQLWAADCLPSLNGQPVNPFDSLNDLLFPDPPHPATQTTPAPLQNTDSHQAILAHYQESLSNLVSCSDGEHAPNSYDAFTALANASMTSSAGQGLHLSVLAWAGRHMVNQGQLKYEAVSERLGTQASQIILDMLARDVETRALESKELVTLFAGILMLVQYKICRGDVWGFDLYIAHLSRLSSIIFPERPTVELSRTQWDFFENLVYHDTVSSSLMTRGPIVPEATLLAYTRPNIDSLHTLTGVSLESFCIMHRIASLYRQKRSAVTDEALADLMGASTRVEKDLEREKQRLDMSVRAKPHLSSHRYFHEAFRIACLLQLRVFVLGNTPSSLNVRFLVRRALSLLEAMADQDLPGFCSAHWVIFTTAACATPGGSSSGEPDDRQRVGRVYEKAINLAFLNTSRSRKIVEDVWSKNQEGRILVDWVDILAEYDWEIIFA